MPGYELTPSFQSLKKLEFSTGKTGIGAFALNVTNCSLTQAMHLCLDTGAIGAKFGGLGQFDRIIGDDNLKVSDWLSAMVNAHVDVAKDPYIFTLNVNSVTWNYVNLLLRSGKGVNTFAFIAQPALAELANRIISSKGLYGNNVTIT